MKTTKSKSLILETLKIWNEVPFSRPLLGRCTVKNIEFYISSLHLDSGTFLEELKELLRPYEGAGIAFLGYCGNSEFQEQPPEASVDVNDSRFKRYRLYLATNIEEVDGKDLTERCELITELLNRYKS